MLAYWYNAPRNIKLILIVAVCMAVYVANQVQPLSPIYTVLSLIFGFGLHAGHYLNSRISNNESYKSSFRLLSSIYTILIVVILMYLLPAQHKWTLAIQALGFVLVGFFLVSIHQNRAKRFD
ncbi:hypothetical protein MWMV2_MWMV2_02764 [Acinetobacter oleivorans]|nr:hypothetical protein MWMV5_MWMV5_02737 [Acinetobacter oleivorans]CAI3151506.1 hypothetical protein MWMV3_MWMV3_02766 [Acinetobacter oleivorans]CAI3151533.1 hypothetical protein MWMV13_MWMV13_02738 [Acinetobacter oleivorans]CAI3151800.1 hypothetical protein MWMV12_MWMV12_02764 [Acinetobacter oleivorans]CAI3151976.1 hypothetical protein MWMV2_MWMV2_02764 [Acinetobacter oleivorans]